MKFEMKDLDTTSMIKNAINEMRQFVKEKKLKLIENKSGNLPTIFGDEYRLIQVITNLLKNAVKFTDKGSVKIEAKKEKDNILVSVTDTGIGIPKENLKQVWKPLFTTKAKGMGLGLSICKRIVEAHGGRISLRSAEGEGSTFKVTIPFKPKAEGGERIWINMPESLSSTTKRA